MLFAFDLGGTKTLLALIDQRSAPWRIVRLERHASRSFHPGMLSDFLSGVTVEAAGFSLAGPFEGGRCHMTNLGFSLDFADLRHTLGLSRIAFANDLVATAYGLTVLPPECLVPLRPGEMAFPKAVLSLGTGLGQALLLSPETALPSEGGHTDFGPQNEEQWQLLRYLQGRFGHVSYERLLSGPGLLNLYAFVADEAGTSLPAPASPADITACLRDPASAAPEFLALCRACMDLYGTILGAKAGNLALETMAYGGIYLAGGMTPHLLPYLRSGGFHEAYCAKGRFSDLISRIPVFAVTDDRAALWGAAALAERERLRGTD